MRAASEAIDLQLACLKRRPIGSESFKRLAVMHSNLAVSLAALELTSEAVHAYQHAIDFQNKLLVANPMDTANQANLMQLYAALLRYQIQQEQWREAEQTLTSYRVAAESQPEHIISAASSIAEIAKSLPESKHQELFTANIAALFASGKEQGMDIKPAILENDAFANFSKDSRIRRVVQQ